MSYKQIVYDYYRSSFKGDTSKSSLRFGAGKIRPILEPWVKELDKNLPVADLGCGAGELLMALKSLGFANLSGCDLSAEQVSIAKQEFPAVQEANLFHFLSSEEDNFFILITLFDVVEHLTRQETFDLMKLIRQKLKPGGILVIHMPNGISPFVGHVFWGDITHEWCMTPQSAATLCSLHGFKEFEAKEHLGAGNGIKGQVRKFAWFFIRGCFRLINAAETGRRGTRIWTRNFAFKAKK
ncbi:MAG: class I SAM-dependent methyltransferase [Chitinophagaceae bacterium]